MLYIYIYTCYIYILDIERHPMIYIYIYIWTSAVPVYSITIIMTMSMIMQFFFWLFSIIFIHISMESLRILPCIFYLGFHDFLPSYTILYSVTVTTCSCPWSCPAAVLRRRWRYNPRFRAHEASALCWKHGLRNLRRVINHFTIGKR